MSLEIPNQNPMSLKEKYLSKVDKNGYIHISDFSTQELSRQSKSVAAFLDGDMGTNPDINFGKDIRFTGDSGNYDMRVHIDDLEKFVTKVKDYYGD